LAPSGGLVVMLNLAQEVRSWDGNQDSLLLSQHLVVSCLISCSF
jgi:hypothetical protein